MKASSASLAWALFSPAFSAIAATSSALVIVSLPARSCCGRRALAASPASQAIIGLSKRAVKQERRGICSRAALLSTISC